MSICRHREWVWELLGHLVGIHPPVSHPAAKSELYLLWQTSRKGSANLQNKQVKNKIHLQSTIPFPHIQIAFHFCFLLSSLSCSLAKPCSNAKVWAESACCYISGAFRANPLPWDIKSTGCRWRRGRKWNKKEVTRTLDSWSWVLLPRTRYMASQQLPKTSYQHYWGRRYAGTRGREDRKWTMKQSFLVWSSSGTSGNSVTDFSDLWIGISIHWRTPAVSKLQ